MYFVSFYVGLQKGSRPEANAVSGNIVWKSLGTPAIGYLAFNKNFHLSADSASVSASLGPTQPDA